MTETFSGAHPYRPQCVLTAARAIFDKELPDAADQLSLMVAERVTAAVANDACPRCSDPLLPQSAPGNWKPAGSRALPCRCVPVCETCASYIEPNPGGTTPVTFWPTDTDIRDDHDGATQKELEQAIVAQFKARLTTVTLSMGSVGPVLLTDDGVTPVALRPNPGGWLQHGYDADQDEQERRA